MLNEERVKHMTKMAIFEKKEARKVQPVLRYGKKDYVDLCMIVHFFLGTAIYVLVFGVVFALLFSTIMTNIHMITAVLGVVFCLTGYIVYIFFYIKTVKQKYALKYEQGVEQAQKLRRMYQKLQCLYEEEAGQNAPEGKD